MLISPKPADCLEELFLEVVTAIKNTIYATSCNVNRFPHKKKRKEISFSFDQEALFSWTNHCIRGIAPEKYGVTDKEKKD